MLQTTRGCDIDDVSLISTLTGLMDKFSGPQDIYENLVENAPDDEEWLLGLVAFAVIEEQKIEWMKHRAEHRGSIPSAQDIDRWYEQQTSGVLLRAKDTAESRLTDYAKNSIAAYMDEAQAKIEEGIIVGEIREIKKFWPQFGVNLAGGFVSALLFAGILTIFTFIVYIDPSPVDIGENLGRQFNQNTPSEKTEVIDNE